MKNRYSDSSTRPHSSLVGSPFRNVVKRFDADLVKQHHMSSVSKAHSSINDQPEPVFAQILDRRGIDPGSRPPSPGASAASPNRSSSSSSGGGGGASSYSFMSSNSSLPSTTKKKVVKKRRTSSPSRRTPSPERAAAAAAAGGGAGYSPASNVFSSHRNKVHTMAHKQRSREGGAESYSQQQHHHHSSPSAGSGHHHKVSVSDSSLIRGGGASSPSSPSNSLGGLSASPSANMWGSNSGGGGSNNNNNRPTSSPRSRSPYGSRAGGGGRPGSAESSPSYQQQSQYSQQNRPQFGTSQSYQRWSNTSPGFGGGGDAFSTAMKGSRSFMDDAETVEVRREIQGAIDAFLHRPVARRFAEETSRWVEEHVLPFANNAGQQALGIDPNSSSVGGGFGKRPGSAQTQNSSNDSRDGSARGGGGGAGGANSDLSLAARRQKTLQMTEAVLPLLFHHIAAEIRDVVRLRIEAALLKRETRISYL